VKRIDITNKQYEHFTVLKLGPAKRYPCGAMVRKWICLCECGNTFQAIYAVINRGTVWSCGCLNFTKPHGNAKREPREVSWRALVNAYKQRARRDDLIWDIKRNEAISLFQSSCTYCGCPPGNQFNVYQTKKGRFRTKNIDRCSRAAIMFNGIDRIDSKKGYMLNNTVACCKICNYAKGSMSYNAFMKWINKLVKFRSAE